ncbi:hypothetical protein MKW92_006189 [Papaver armeniacum]|nr:hypothetical protein MKW92_006189 [Papaver armeniacum]
MGVTFLVGQNLSLILIEEWVDMQKDTTVQEELLEKLRTASWNAAVQDMEDLRKFSQEQGAIEANDLSHWDLSFWSERLRESKYDINEEELRPYFSLPKVMDGLFSLAKTLFDIDVEAADGLAPDQRFLRGMDGRGCFAKSCSDGTSARLPVAHMVCRQSPPVETVFHEFGHALQHMLTKEDEGLVFGIRGIEWDVEFHSQFMENRCYQRDTLMSLAKHYETGETLPEEVYLKLLAARTFRAGTQSLRQIKFASTDLELQVSYIPGGSESIFILIEEWARKPLPEDRFLCGFSHIFAEVLSADAFSAVEDAGLDNEKAVKETGRKFRETVLAVGSGKPPLEVFVQFEGVNLLRHNGLLVAATASA